MDDLLKKYKEKIEVLPISSENKSKIYDSFYDELQFKLLDAFVDTLTPDQQKQIADASSDEEAVKIYFSLLNESVEMPEFVEFIEKIYTEILEKALKELPSSESLSRQP